MVYRNISISNRNIRSRRQGSVTRTGSETGALAGTTGGPYTCNDGSRINNNRRRNTGNISTSRINSKRLIYSDGNRINHSGEKNTGNIYGNRIGRNWSQWVTTGSSSSWVPDSPTLSGIRPRPPTATAQARERASLGPMTKLTTYKTLWRLLTIPESALETTNSQKIRQALLQDYFGYSVPIAKRWEIGGHSSLHYQTFTKSHRHRQQRFHMGDHAGARQWAFPHLWSQEYPGHQSERLMPNGSHQQTSHGRKHVLPRRAGTEYSGGLHV